MQRIVSDSFAVQVPNGWGDITDSVESESPPFTLARPDGVGALQFSIATFKSGPTPNPTPTVLLDMLVNFGHSRDLGIPNAVNTEIGPPVLAAGNFVACDDSIRVWYVSDGRNFAFITYTASNTDFGPELPDCETIVRSIDFRVAN